MEQFWSNNILVLLCDGPKPNISMISGFLSPGEPLFMDLNIPKILQKIWSHAARLPIEPWHINGVEYLFRRGRHGLGRTENIGTT